jgi:hypothetical protein
VKIDRTIITLGAALFIMVLAVICLLLGYLGVAIFGAAAALILLIKGLVEAFRKGNPPASQKTTETSPKQKRG